MQTAIFNPPIVGEPIDPTSKEGFLELASAFGRERAHEARIACYAALYEANKDFRWHGEKFQRRLQTATFERDWELANPRDAALLREAGVSY